MEKLSTVTNSKKEPVTFLFRRIQFENEIVTNLGPITGISKTS